MFLGGECVCHRLDHILIELQPEPWLACLGGFDGNLFTSGNECVAQHTHIVETRVELWCVKHESRRCSAKDPRMMRRHSEPSSRLLKRNTPTRRSDAASCAT